MTNEFQKIGQCLKCGGSLTNPHTCSAEEKEIRPLYPICPECGKSTVVLFAPPKDPPDFSLIGKEEYTDWYRAHLYCCNGETDCKFQPLLTDLTTPLKQPKDGVCNHPEMTCKKAHEHHVAGLIQRDHEIEDLRQELDRAKEEIRELNKQIAGLMSGMNLNVYREKIEEGRSTEQRMREAIKTIRHAAKEVLNSFGCQNPWERDEDIWETCGKCVGCDLEKALSTTSEFEEGKE